LWEGYSEKGVACKGERNFLDERRRFESRNDLHRSPLSYRSKKILAFVQIIGRERSASRGRGAGVDARGVRGGDGS